MSGFEMRLYDMDDAEPRRSTKVSANRANHYAVAEVAGGAGWVGVDRFGELTEVEFDEQIVRSMRPEHLGDYLVTALRQAEEMALRKRRDAILGGTR